MTSRGRKYLSILHGLYRSVYFLYLLFEAQAYIIIEMLITSLLTWLLSFMLLHFSLLAVTCVLPPFLLKKHSDRAPCRQPVGGLHEHNVGRTRAREQGEYEPAHRARSRAQRAFSWKSVNS